MKFNVQLPVSIFREGAHYIAYTPVLDLSTAGKNYEEVVRRFHEIVTIFFEELIKKGTLAEVLTNLGWKRAKRHWMPPTLVSQESREVEFAIK